MKKELPRTGQATVINNMGHRSVALPGCQPPGLWVWGTERIDNQAGLWVWGRKNCLWAGQATEIDKGHLLKNTTTKLSVGLGDEK